MKLNEYNLSNNLILKIYNFYKHNTLRTITENPYSLIKDIKGIMCQVYKIIEWYPVYPVIRDPTVLPRWIYPTEFINIYDMSDEPVW